MNDEERDQLTPEERTALALWKSPAPPAGFAARVAGRWERERGEGVGIAPDAANDAPLARRPSRPRRGWMVATAAAAVVCAGVATWLVAARLGDHSAAGERAFTAREALALGDRAVAVAEAGAALRWNVDGSGAARVDQSAGSIFYRVEPGGSFVVATPAGEVTVRGTCFRVEVSAMKLGISAVALKGAVAGAALAALVTVLVYEGKVLLANERGGTEVLAGETASAETGGAPGPATDARLLGRAGASGGAGARADPAAAAALLAAPGPEATRAELLARDEALRRELAMLRARLGGLEVEIDGPPAGKRGGPPAIDGSYFEPTKEELLTMAERCELRWDLPSTEADPRPTDPELLAKLGATETERAALRTMHDEFHHWLIGELRKLYIEATGDDAGAGSLSPTALGNEITDKSLPGERGAIARRLAEERAGLVAPPVDLTGTSPQERYMRIMAGLGDEYERRVAGVLGPARAHEMRADGDGWPSQWRAVGCPKE